MQKIISESSRKKLRKKCHVQGVLFDISMTQRASQAAAVVLAIRQNLAGGLLSMSVIAQFKNICVFFPP